MTKTIAPYGTWNSPITADLLNAATVGLGQIALDGEDIYWVEIRPLEGGRGVLVRRTPTGALTDVTPPGFSVRTRVHEYGGGAYLVVDGVVYFSNFADNRIYRQPIGQEPVAYTPAIDVRYADFLLDRTHQRLILVCEDHRAVGSGPDGQPYADNWIGTIALADATANVADAAGWPDTTPQHLTGGHDFASSPALSPDGIRLAWLTWDHPNMPWDGTDLWLADVQPDGTLGTPRHIAGGREESIIQPTWSPDGMLYYLSDRSGWWNLYRHEADQERALCPRPLEFGGPQWVLGMSFFGFVDPDHIVGALIDHGQSQLYDLTIATGQLSLISTPFTAIGSQILVTPSQVCCIGASSTEPWTIVTINPVDHQIVTVRRSSTANLDSDTLAIAEPIEFPTTGGATAHAFFYAPRNRDYAAPDGELPPLLVISHGGPTSMNTSALSLSNVQYWTSRGFAVVDVNYGGSTGYGRDYRRRLNGNWGVVDLDDCVNAARYLVQRGEVDAARLAIRGGSAGGYTTLCALTFRDVFKAGASYYGVSDLEALHQETHKFESRYDVGLIAPYPEGRETFIARSPIHFADQINCPVIFLQGADDKIVPPNQAEMLVDALRHRNIPVAYLLFAGEGHGFRKAENTKRAIEAELYFYGKVFGFTPADEIAPVAIENLTT